LGREVTSNSFFFNQLLLFFSPKVVSIVSRMVGKMSSDLGIGGTLTSDEVLSEDFELVAVLLCGFFIMLLIKLAGDGARVPVVPVVPVQVRPVVSFTK
jgi:hypothetical protein